jgi:hypothetical protein
MNIDVDTSNNLTVGIASNKRDPLISKFRANAHRSRRDRLQNRNFAPGFEMPVDIVARQLEWLNPNTRKDSSRRDCA